MDSSVVRWSYVVQRGCPSNWSGIGATLARVRAPALVGAARRHNDDRPPTDHDICARIGTTASECVYCVSVTIRAIVANASPEGTWKGVWNDGNSEPQLLG